MKKEIRKVLVVNSGSSSLKYQLFDMKTETRLAKGLVERIGCGGPKDHGEALREVVKQLEKTVPAASSPRGAGKAGRPDSASTPPRFAGMWRGPNLTSFFAFAMFALFMSAESVKTSPPWRMR